MYKSLIILLLCFSPLLLLGQEDIGQKVDHIFGVWDKEDGPGGALGIVQDGKLIYAKGYGMADLEHNIPIDPSSVFYIASVSKHFVTFSILLLEEQGKLDLDDPIQKYLPDFPEYEAPLTIRHFIHHTSGVRDYLTLMSLKGRDYLDHTEAKEVYELIKRQKELNFSPGEKYLYSNSCYFMLAMIIEKVSGMSMKAFGEKYIFEPLGMKNTLFYDDNKDLIKNRVFSYNERSEIGKYDNLIMRFDLVGSGGVYSNIEDLFLWDQNFYNNKLGKGGQTIIEKMHEEGLLNSGRSSGYAFGLNNGTYKGLRTVSHGGALAGYRSHLLRFPDQNFTVIILANRGDANPANKAYQVANILLKDQFAEETAKAADKSAESAVEDNSVTFSIAQLAGRYEVQPGVALKITVKNNALNVVQTWNNATYFLLNQGGNGYVIPGASDVKFTFSDLKDDQTQTLTVIQQGNKTVARRKAEADLSTIKLEDFVGSYYSEELDVSYAITLKDDQLIIKAPNQQPQDMLLTDLDSFVASGELFRFSRTGDTVTGFELDAGRVTNLKFVKN